VLNFRHHKPGQAREAACQGSIRKWLDGDQLSRWRTIFLIVTKGLCGEEGGIPAAHLIDSLGLKVAGHTIQNFAVDGLKESVIQVKLMGAASLRTRETFVITFISLREPLEQFDLFFFAHVDSS